MSGLRLTTLKTRKDPRHQARRLAVLVLFEWAFHPDRSVSENVDSIVKEGTRLLTAKGSAAKYKFDSDLFEELLLLVSKYKHEIDEIIAKSAPEWPLDQISKVDLSILRLAIAELLHREATPTKVAIDEAVELAKEFGGANSSKFVNGVLGTVVKEYLSSEGGEVETTDAGE